MKFKQGDRFKVKDEYSELGMTGTVTGTSFNSIYQRDEYVVLWDTNKLSPETYSMEECDRMWNHECPVVGQVDSRPYWIKEMAKESAAKPETSTVMCQAYGHEWIEVGFQFTKTICKRCDVSKNA